jgi:hypothetical protein
MNNMNNFIRGGRNIHPGFFNHPHQQPQQQLPANQSQQPNQEQVVPPQNQPNP